MNTTLKSIFTALTLTASTITFAGDNLGSNSMAAPNGNYTAEAPAIFDLGEDWAIVFYYDNENSERTVVTTVAPKDPDANRAASEHIVSLKPGESYTATLASSDPRIEPIAINVPYSSISNLHVAQR